MQAHAARRAGHEHRVTGSHRADRDHGVIRRPNRTRGDARPAPIHPVRDRHDPVRVDRQILRVSPVQPGIAQEHHLRAQRFPPGPAIPAGAAHMRPLRRRDPVADPHPAHVPPHRRNPAGDLVPEDHRHLHARLQRAAADDHVVIANPAMLHRDHDLSGARRRVGHGFGLQHALRRPRGAHDHGPQSTATGATGLPVAPTMGSGVATNRNSVAPSSPSSRNTKPSSSGTP